VNVQELLDNALEQGDLVPPSSQDYIDRRRLARSFLIEVFQDAYWRRDWPFKRKGPEAIVVPASGGRISAPLDFQSLGVFGGLYTTDGDKLLEVPESVIIDGRAADSRDNNTRMFSIFGQDPSTYKVYFQFPPSDVEATYNLWYQPHPPPLLDAGDLDFIDTAYATTGGGLTQAAGLATFTANAAHGFATGDLLLMSGANEAGYNVQARATVVSTTVFTYPVAPATASPATGTPQAALDLAAGNLAINAIDPQYHRVLLNGVKAKLRESKGDARWQFLQGEYEKGIKAMLDEEQRQQSDGMKQIPSFFGGYGRSRY
jgi:hypothetical protein